MAEWRVLSQKSAQGGVGLKKGWIADQLGFEHKRALGGGLLVENVFDLRDFAIPQRRIGLSNQRAVKEVAGKKFQTGDRVRVSVEEIIQLGVALQVRGIHRERRVEPQVVFEQGMVVEEAIEFT